MNCNDKVQVVLNHVNKTYIIGEQPLQVLKDINLTIHSGDYISIMGPSGSGKSTLLNMLGLLDRPDSGELLFSDLDTVNLSEEKRTEMRRDTIGFIFQNFQLIPRLTALENAELPLVLAGVSKSERLERVSQLFTELGMIDRMHHLPKQLSGGQLQRVAIARAMVMAPKVLLADEPTGNLDQKSGHEVIDVLETLNHKGITLIVVTHDRDLGSRANRQLVMVDGAITHENIGVL